MANISPDLSSFIPGQNQITWKDFLYSNDAAARGLLNYQYSIPQSAYDNILLLFDNIVTPLLNAYPNKIKVSSGFRSAAVNTSIGGSTTSQHLTGQAVDLVATGIGFNNKDIFNWIVANVPQYDQVIWEKGTLPLAGNPRWVHASFATGANRKQLLQTQDGQTYRPINSSTIATGANQPDGTDSQAGAKQLLADIASETQNFSAVFDQIERNVQNTELSDTTVTWGKRSNPNEDSDWITLKQFLLYLATRYMPHTLFPFVELIPDTTVASGPSDGEVPSDVQNNILKASKKIKDLKKQAKIIDDLKFMTELPPGYSKEKFDSGAAASNRARNNADLFSLDPFKEGNESLYTLSAGGEAIKKEKGIGVRVYGQVVLTPAPIDGVPSKPGAIGFTDLEVHAGAQTDNGMALIKMTLIDVQGNKFTDINSPWAFIYDAAPMNGGYWFRYGWQLRMPTPADKSDLSSRLFWNHPGWALFEKEKIQLASQMLTGKNIITLTQAINTDLADTKTGALALFEEGVEYNSLTDQVSINKSNVDEKNYVKLSILNPEIVIDANGAITASLSFRTTGAITQLIPLQYATFVRTMCAKGNVFFLTDLILSVVADSQLFGSITEPEAKKVLKQQTIQDDLQRRRNTRNVDNLVYVVGLDDGAGGDVHPDSIVIKISNKYMKQIMTPTRDASMTLIRWLRQVLQDNECELQSAATGSGAGINSSWIITTTQQIEKEKIIYKKEINNNSAFNQLQDTLVGEKDVFAFRHQGSLVENISIEKSDTPTSMSIKADYAVGDLLSFEGTSQDLEAELKKPLTAAGRKRNLMAIFAQMQSCSIDALAHPWIGPGKTIFVKGMGFYDGGYICMEVIHKLSGHKFTSTIKGSRILLGDKKKEQSENISLSQQNGKNNFCQNVTKQYKEQSTSRAVSHAPQQTISGTTVNSSSLWVTLEELVRMVKQRNPNVGTAQLKNIVEPLNETLRAYNINSLLRISHFLAQVMHESSDFAFYREQGSLTYFNKYEPNTILGASLGNTLTGDGAKYKGRGAIRITGRTNYQSIGVDLSFDFINKPGALETPQWGTHAAGWFWDDKGLNEFADFDDITTITKKINGGSTGLLDRQNRLDIAKQVLEGKQFS